MTMADITSSPRPAPAALVTGCDTPEGQSVAVALARAGYRICLLGSEGQAAFEPAQLPGHERLAHEAVRADLSDARAVRAAALDAQSRLGHVTALVHVVLPSAAAVPSSAATHPGFDGERFARELAVGAGAFLGLAMSLLPGMLGSQTGCLSVLGEAPAEGTPFVPDDFGVGASLGALLGAVRQLADHCDGTELRSVAFLTDAGPRRAVNGAALTSLVAQLGPERASSLIRSGWFMRVGGAKRQGPIDLLRSPSAAPTAVVQSAAPIQNGAGASAQKDRLGEKLAHTFRAAFGLAAGVDVSNLAVGDVKRWDSLGHLKLMMEVEQALRVRLPADALSRIRSYRDLEKAVRAYLPAT